MFEGFSFRRVPTSGAEINLRIGGEGPPLLLLHGYPQMHAMWHAVAPALARAHTVVCPDLPGYGDSSKPPSTPDHAAYSKRAMAADLVYAMSALGFERFAVAGHDRGGRVAYRMALDHPERVARLATLDIVPTYSSWNVMDWRAGLGTYHWFFLAQPAPLPETLIAGDPMFYLHSTLRRWAAPSFAFDPAALAEYERAFANPETVRACCEDYRAGAGIDYQLDEADFGKKKIACPMLALWGQREGAPERNVIEVWNDWAEDVRGLPIRSGHFLGEEAPGPTLAALLEFFGEG
jgi:haloacetate dehalogenase